MIIRWQSFVNSEINKPYIDRLHIYLNSIAAPGNQVEIVEMFPPARDFGRLQEFRCAQTVVRNAIQAEQDGCGAFVIGHFQESGLYEARASCNIPITGMGEATLLWASHLGRRFGLISLDDAFEVIHLEQMERYSLLGRLAGIKGINFQVADFASAFEDDTSAYERIVAKFSESARELIKAGADILVPAGGLFGLLTTDKMGFSVDGIPVIPCTPITLGWAEMSLNLQKNQGLTPSRGPSFSQSTDRAIQDFLTEGS